MKLSGLLLQACLGAYLLLGVCNLASAQSNSSTAAPGTYQLIFPSKRDDVKITLSEKELQTIERLRKENEVVYAQASYNDYLRIRILPRAVIAGKDFIPVVAPYYKDEHSYEENRMIRYIHFD